MAGGSPSAMWRRRWSVRPTDRGGRPLRGAASFAHDRPEQASGRVAIWESPHCRRSKGVGEVTMFVRRQPRVAALNDRESSSHPGPSRRRFAALSVWALRRASSVKDSIVIHGAFLCVWPRLLIYRCSSSSSRINSATCFDHSSGCAMVRCPNDSADPGWTTNRP
jgi:hypothetical protein